MINTSHDSYFELEGYNLTVHYPEIMLADSTSNEPGSKGYFQFKVKPLEPLELGQTIENDAAIFFDFNDPIITNIAITQAEMPDFINENSFVNFSVYPNPSKGEVSIKTSENILGISCTNLLGEIVQLDSEVNSSRASLSFNDQKGIFIILVETNKGFARQRIVIE